MREWSTKSSEFNSVKAIIKDKHGTEKYLIDGKFTQSLFAHDLSTGEKWTIFTAP